MDLQTNTTYWTKDQVLKAVQGRPSSTSPTDIINGLQSRGVIMQGYNDEGTQAPWFNAPSPKQDTSKKPGLMSRIGATMSSVFKNGPPSAIPGLSAAVDSVQSIDWGAKAGDIINSIQKPQQDVLQQKGLGTTFKDIGVAATTAVGNVAGGGVQILGNLFNHIPGFPQAMSAIMNNSDVGGIPVQKIASQAQKEWNNFQLNYPDASKAIGNLFNVAGALTANIGEPEATKAAQTVADTVSSLGGTPEEKALQTATDALNPDLTGKNLTAAYKKGALSGTLEKGGILSGQSAGIDASVTKLANNLKDIVTSKDPLVNLQNLGKAMNDTEAQLQTILQSDKTPIVKQAFSDALDATRDSIPREFTRIGGDSGKAVDDVFQFAKEKVNEADPTINGMRNARIEFDTQARAQYPNAFKNGMIDTKTAAGNAIKVARDAMNDYMYQTAQQGSQLQQLIGREADIYRGIDNIAPKAAANDSQGAVQKIYNTIRQHKVATLGGAYVADKVIKATTGVGVPGL